jgi:aryl-alcohol dehydrogenase-like predicted oxidoreductase
VGHEAAEVSPVRCSRERDDHAGRGGSAVSRAGLGLTGMADIDGQADDHESLATIWAAIDAGITLLDTTDFYGMGHNELLLRDALRGIPRDSVSWLRCS